MAIYGTNAAVQAAIAQAAAQASLAAGHAASASSVVQQDLSGVNAAALHRSPNAVTAMFVYDTSKDSDGGAWTEKCQHTSWYNEEINGKWLGSQASEAAARAVSGATTGDYFQLTTDGKFYKLNATSGITEVFRGNKRDFPRLAAIVGENFGGTASFSIYDLTEPGRPMWMRMYAGAWSSMSGVLQSLGMLNGKLLVCLNQSLAEIDFPADAMFQRTNSGQTRHVNDISRRHVAGTSASRVLTGLPGIANSTANAVAMTVLPDAPVDPVTGLKVPTIAVATGSGVSVIQHSGVVNTIGSASNQRGVAYIGKMLVVEGVVGSSYNQWTADDVTKGASAVITIRNPGRFDNDASVPAWLAPLSNRVLASAYNRTSAFRVALSRFNRETQSRSAAAHITNNYHTGWMAGDIRRAYLADVDVGSVSGTELVTNGTFDADTDWTKGTGWTISGGVATANTTTGSERLTSSANWLGQNGKTYFVSATVTMLATPNSNAMVGINVGGVGQDIWINSQTGLQAGQTYNVRGVARPTSASVFLIRIGSGNGLNYGLNYTIDNISVKEAVSDRSYKASGAPITGTLTKTAVASAAQLVAYSGFSGSNYLREPYSADLDFGTGEWSAGAWVNMPTVLPESSFSVVDVTGVVWTRTAGDGVLSVSGNTVTITGATTATQVVRTAGSIPLAPGLAFMTIRADWVTATGVAFWLRGIPQALSNGVAMSRSFSLNNSSLERLDVGTGTVTFTISRFAFSSAPTIIFDRAHSIGPRIALGVLISGSLQAIAYDGTTTHTVTTTAAYNTATWVKAEACYTTDGTLAIRVNGQEVAATRGNPLLTLNNSNAVLTIGNSYLLDAPFPGSIALLKLSTTVPTPEQSVWMYEQEKQMFREGAQVCLPDSGSIVDLAYDEATDKWIAASATNISEWSGLVRTNVTTVPSGSYSKLASAGGVTLQGRTTTTPGVDITIPAYGLREELVKRAESAARMNAQLAVFDYVGGFTATTVTGSTAITSVAGLTYPASYIGAVVTGAGIPANTTVASVSGTTIYLSAAATASATGVQISFTDFALPVGYEAKEVSLGGVSQVEGSTKAFVRRFDGFKETIRFNTATAYNAAIQIQAARSAA